jgi:hypothetical protein
MTYAAPFAYASQAIIPDPYSPAARPHRKVRQRRRRLRTAPFAATLPR